MFKLCRFGRTTFSASYSTQNRAYDPHSIEPFWQKKWHIDLASNEIHNQLSREGESKYYVLSMFPYPSGMLHMGHVRVYTISDTLARYNKMKGKQVLHPMGWDSFGLPAENAAIDKGINPVEWTDKNIEVMRGQLLSLGCHFDWNREISTCSPHYYKWTQWLFVQLYKHRLAYKKMALVNWDPVDQTVLANEQVDTEGRSWRSGAKVQQKYLNQWFFKISDYAEELLDGLDEVDWSDGVKDVQRSWIGKSQGAFFDFKLQGASSVSSLKVFTTQPETVYGVSFIAISTEHDICTRAGLLAPDVVHDLDKMRNSAALSYNRRKVLNKAVDLKLSALHPFTGNPIPIYAADYVVGDYGTKAVMGVPAHDERDSLLALRHHLPVVAVRDESSSGGSILLNSGEFSGLSVGAGADAIIQHAHSLSVGGKMTQYKLQDWLISRQRYWGAPIPILYCDKCGSEGMVPVPEEQLPVLLPLDGVELSGRGPSPLAAKCSDWQTTSCGRPGCCARRETDTMDTFVDSSWYFLRYISPRESSRPFSEDVFSWMPVDIYIGGIEHAVLHLLYARFITHFLYNVGLLKTREPFQKLLTQGMVQGRTFRGKSSGRYLTKEEQETVHQFPEEVEETWEKMSKSKNNGVDPQDVISKYGADTVRIYVLFKAPPVMDIQWDVSAIHGIHKWLHRVWNLCQEHISACTEPPAPGGAVQKKRELLSAQHTLIKEVSFVLDHHTYNRAIAELMKFSNSLKDFKKDLLGTAEYHLCLMTLCTLLSPMAPHIASELWEDLAQASHLLNLPKPGGSVFQEKWPSWNREFILQEADTIEIHLHVNGTKRGMFPVSSEVYSAELSDEMLRTEALRVALESHMISSRENVEKIFVVTRGKMVNIATK